MSFHAGRTDALDPPVTDDSTRPDRPERHLATPLMAFASIGAGLVHAAVVPEHSEWWPSTTFFVVLAVFQLGWGVLALVRPVRGLFLALGIGVNAAALLLWLGSRTAGVPFGPHKNEAEPFARTDVLGAVLEVALVLAALWWVGVQKADRAPQRMPRFGLATGATGAVVAAVSIVALTGAAGHSHPPTMGRSGEHAGHGTHAPADLQPVSVQENKAPAKQSVTPKAPARRAAAVTPGVKKATPKGNKTKPVTRRKAATPAKTTAGKAVVPTVVPPAAPPAAPPAEHKDDGHSH